MRIIKLVSFFVLLFAAGICVAETADMSGSWSMETSNGYHLTLSISQKGSSISGSMSRAGDPDSSIQGTVNENGVIFWRNSQDLKLPQFYGGAITATRLFNEKQEIVKEERIVHGAYCHEHTECDKTFVMTSK